MIKAFLLFFLFSATALCSPTPDEILEQLCNVANDTQREALVKQLNEALACQPEPCIEPVEQSHAIMAIEQKPTISDDKQFVETLERIKKQKPAHLELFMKHHSLINTPTFAIIKKTNPCWFPGSRTAFWKKSDTAITNYLTLTQKFFTTQEPITSLFAYQIAENCLHLELLKNDFSRGIIWAWLLGKPEIAHVLEKMLTVMLTIHGHVIEMLLPKNTSLMANIMSGEWVEKITRVVKHPNGMFGLDVASDLLKNKQFKDLQTAGLYALAYTTPSLFTKVLSYFRPSKEDAKIIEALQLSAHATNDPVRVSDFLITFVDNHPELFEKITTEHPEILDLLALQLKNLVTPAHRV